MRFLFLTAAVLLAASAAVQAQPTEFDPDSAYANVEYLAVTIGPRPIGSNGERQALRWVSQRLGSFGADSVYILRIRSTRGFNTETGVAVGVFRGRSDSTIVIGGHIDSAPRQSPGANDDASGIACLVELARVWSQRARRYTLVFAAFGGEEQGLVGSSHFVEHYPDIEDVVLMLQIDMAGDDSELTLFLDPVPGFGEHQTQAPRWLVRDVLTLDHELGLDWVDYPTHFFSWNSTLGLAASDHVPFLARGIPALDFTSGVNTSPIHTPRDRFDFISRNALARTGTLVHGLLRKYNEDGLPTETSAPYLLLSVLGRWVFVPRWGLVGLCGLALGLGAFAFWHSRSTRLEIPQAERVRLSGSKLFLMTVGVALAAQAGEAVLQVLKGWRFPWMAPFEAYLWLAGVCALVGVWVVLQLTRTWAFSPDPYVYAKRALALLFLLTGGALAGSVRLAAYPAAALLLFSLAVLVRNGPLKLLLTVLAPWPLFRLMFMEMLPFFGRSLAAETPPGFGPSFFLTLALTALLTLWYLPATYGFGYAAVTVTPFRQAVRRFRGPVAGWVGAAALLAYGVYVFSLPAYDQRWRPTLRANAHYDLQTETPSLRLSSNEYFHDVTVAVDTLNERYRGRVLHADLEVPFRADWLRVDGRETVNPDSTVDVHWRLVTLRPWYYARLLVRADTSQLTLLRANWKYYDGAGGLSFTWMYDPPDTLEIAATLKLLPGAELIREVTAAYPEWPLPVQITAPYADVTRRTTVTYRDTLKLPWTQTTRKD